MKKVVIIIVSLIIVIGLTIGVTLFLNSNNKKSKTNNKKEEEKEATSNIASTIIIDINPSVEINLDKDGKIISMNALNEDAMGIIPENYEGKDFSAVLDFMVKNLINEGYITDKTAILINVTGEITSDDVKEVIEDNLKKVNIECKIIVQEINEDAHENAQKYGISDSKASYIEEIIKENENLSFEELKDKSIEELNNIKEQPKEEEPSEPVDSGNYSSGYADPPADPTDRSGVWCTWNQNRPQWYEYYYNMISGTDAMNKAMSILGVSFYDLIGNYASASNYEPRSSYCIANVVVLTTRETRYYYLLDSVTNEVIEVKTEAVPTPNISEEQAIQMSLDQFNIKAEDCNVCQASYGTNAEGGPDFYYRYSVSIYTYSGEQHATDVNAQTGALRVIY